MRSRALLSVLAIFLILALVNCGFISPGEPEWPFVEDVVNY